MAWCPPSVRLTQTGVLSTWLNMSSRNPHRRMTAYIGTLVFRRQGYWGKIQRSHPKIGHQICTRGVGKNLRLSTTKTRHLGNGTVEGE